MGRRHTRKRHRINGQRIKKPLNTRNWSEAQRMARELETGGIIEQRTAPLVKDATEAFLNDARARGLRDSSIYKLRLLTTRLQEFSANKGFDFISDYNLERASSFRETWTNKGTAARKKLEALRTFFRFCVDRKWLDSNPAKALQMPKNRTLSHLLNLSRLKKLRRSWRRSSIIQTSRMPSGSAP